MPTGSRTRTAKIALKVVQPNKPADLVRVDMENDNCNHSKESVQIKRSRKLSGKQEEPKKKQRANSSSAAESGTEQEIQVMQEQVQTFQEGDQLIEMHLTGNITSDDEEQDKSETNDHSDNESEDGEISEHHQDNEDLNRSVTGMDNKEKMETSSSSDDDETKQQKRVRKKQRKAKRREKRKSMEDKIDKLSNAILIMQDFIAKQKDNNGNDKIKKKSVKGKSSNEHNRQIEASNSETTIYENALNKVTDEEGHVNIEVDQEVSFKVKNINDSTSSEDKIDTSDELIEIGSA